MTAGLTINLKPPSKMPLVSLRDVVTEGRLNATQQCPTCFKFRATGPGDSRRCKIGLINLTRKRDAQAAHFSCQWAYPSGPPNRVGIDPAQPLASVRAKGRRPEFCSDVCDL